MATKSPTLGSYKSLGIRKPKVVSGRDTCPICGDEMSKRRLRNPCAFEGHRIYA